jgi:hypothetical protein
MCYGPEIRYYCRVDGCEAYIDRGWTLERRCCVADRGMRCTIRWPTTSVRDTWTRICAMDEWIQRLEALERRRREDRGGASGEEA